MLTRFAYRSGSRFDYRAHDPQKIYVYGSGATKPTATVALGPDYDGTGSTLDARGNLLLTGRSASSKS
jgi:hypothetical protein